MLAKKRDPRFLSRYHYHNGIPKIAVKTIEK